MKKENALQRIDSHEKLCRIMQKQTYDKIHKLEKQINRIESILGREMPLDGIKDINGIVRNGVKKQFRFVEMPHEESDIQ